MREHRERGRRDKVFMMPRVARSTRIHAKSMRRAPTEAEQKLWNFLRRKHLAGFKFRRQQPVGPYILDFYCFEAKVAIELDGGGHALDDQRAYDDQRTQYLASQGIRILRFWNNELVKNPEGVCQRIVHALST